MPFAQVPGEILMDDRLKPTHIRVLIALYMHKNKKREEVWPKRKTLSLLTGIHEATISRLTTELDQFGWITKQGNSGGCGRPAAYRVHAPDHLTSKFDTTVNEDGDIVLPATVAKSTTVAESTTVADFEQNHSEIDYLTVAKSARGKEQTKNRPEQTNGVKRASPPATPAIPGVCHELLDDYLMVRKAKKAGPLTKTAIAGLEREADKAGITLSEAITACCEFGWQGFNAGWYADRKGGGSRVLPAGETAYQRSMRERVEQAAPSIARQAPATQQDAADFFRTIDAPARVVAEVRAIGGAR